MPGLKYLFFPSSSRSTLKKHGSRRLTRQRKIRHVTDRRMGLSLSGRSSTAPPTPQPLPLPEFRRERERERGSDQFSQRSKGDGDGRNESIDTRASSLPSETSSLSPRLVTKTTNNLTINSEKPPTYFHSGFPLSPDDEIDNHNFRLNIPARSAPPSGLSSPVRNPQRFNSVDFAPSIPQFLFSSNTKENISNNSGRRTPDSSPLHSPKQKSIFKSTNNHDLHPLPLPPPSPKRTQSPPSPKPIQSPTNINISEKNEGSSKSQWVKGKLIGRGTYGTVFEAFNSATGAMCAMKEVDIMLDDPKSLECIKQLEQEIKILQQLEHKNIVRYYGCEVVEDHFCIYLEYVYPGSISKYIREHFGAITESVVRNFTRHILSGLAYLHSTDTVHRDIKGANLLLDASGVVKLADFGLAKHLTAATYDLSLKGSPHWMAPELLQAVMRKDSDHQHAYAIDIWSLGCTVIEMFNGKPPWSECTGVQALFHVMNKSPEIPESLSPEGKDFLNRCFKRNPADRPSAAQLLKHPFVRNTEQEGLSSCILEFSRLKLAGSPNSQSDVSFSPREWPKSLPTSPRALIRQVPRNSERSKCESARAAPNRSPCSTLEALPSISSPDFNNSPTINSYKSAPNNLRFATGYNYQNINRKARKGFSYSFEGL